MSLKVARNAVFLILFIVVLFQGVPGSIFDWSMTSYAKLSYFQPATEYDNLTTSEQKSNCVAFAHYKIPSLPGGLWTLEDKRQIMNSSSPKVGYAAIEVIRVNGVPNWSDTVGHVCYVESINGDQITTLDGGVDGAHIYRCTGTASDLGIIGYYNPGNTDSTGPTVTDFHVGEIRKDSSGNTIGFTVMAKVTDPSGIKSVQYPTWTVKNGQDDIKCYDGYCTDNNGYYWHRVDFSDHKNEKGKYEIHIYAYDNANNLTRVPLTFNFDSTGPTVSNFHVGEFREGAFTILADVSDINEIEYVHYAVWTKKDNQDDLKWYVGNNFSGNVNGNYWARINFSEHKNEKGKYIVHIYVKIKGGEFKSIAGIEYDFPETGPTISDIRISNVSASGYTVTCKVAKQKDDVAVGVVKFPTWTLKDEQDDLLNDWTTNSKANGTIKNGEVTFNVSASDHNNETGAYRTHIYAYDVFGNKTKAIVPDVNVHNHNYDSEVIQPTKTERGYTLYTCSVCGDSYKDNYTDYKEDEPIHAHAYFDNVKIEPTCTEKGLKEYVCVCGDSYTEDIPATGHKFELIIVEPTDTEDGYTIHKCVNVDCDYEYKDNIVLHKTSEDIHQHNYFTMVIKEATCLEAGLKSYSCECGESYTEEILANGHNYTSQIVVPTPEEKGYTLHTCSVCGDTYKDDYTEYDNNKDNLSDNPNEKPGETPSNNPNTAPSDIKLWALANDGKIQFTWNAPDKAATYGIVYALDEQELDVAEANNGYEVSGLKASGDTMTYECSTAVYENQPGGVWFRVVMKNGDTVKYSNAVRITNNLTDTPSGKDTGSDKNSQNSDNIDSNVTNSEKITLSALTVTKVTPSTNQVTFTWSGDASATGYEIEYSINADLSNSQKSYWNKHSLKFYKLTDLDENTTYYYRLRAYKGEEAEREYSEWTSVASVQTKTNNVTTEAPAKQTYSAPKIMLKSVKNNKKKTMVVKWKWNVKADGYQISYAKKKNFSGAKKKNVNAYKDSVTIKNLTKGKTYYVKIRSFVKDDTGHKLYGKWSSVKKVKIKK